MQRILYLREPKDAQSFFIFNANKGTIDRIVTNKSLVKMYNAIQNADIEKIGELLDSKKISIHANTTIIKVNPEYSTCGEWEQGNLLYHMFYRLIELLKKSKIDIETARNIVITFLKHGANPNDKLYITKYITNDSYLSYHNFKKLMKKNPGITLQELCDDLSEIIRLRNKDLSCKEQRSNLSDDDSDDSSSDDEFDNAKEEIENNPNLTATYHFIIERFWKKDDFFSSKSTKAINDIHAVLQIIINAKELDQSLSTSLTDEAIRQTPSPQCM